MINGNFQNFMPFDYYAIIIIIIILMPKKIRIYFLKFQNPNYKEKNT